MSLCSSFRFHVSATQVRQVAKAVRAYVGVGRAVLVPEAFELAEGAAGEPGVVQGEVVRHKLDTALGVIDADHAVVRAEAPKRNAVDDRVGEVEVGAACGLAGDEQDIRQPDSASADQEVGLSDLHVDVAGQKEDHEGVGRAVDHEVGVAEYEVGAAGVDFDHVEARRGGERGVRINDAGSGGQCTGGG